jgi:predicted transposase YbfD/YdcC
VLPVKENHPTLYRNIERFFQEEERHHFQDQEHEVEEVRDKDHGRIETRRAYLVDLETTVRAALRKDAKQLQHWLDPGGAWAGRQSIGMILRRREIRGEIRGEITEERHYYILSLKGGVQRFSRAARAHWGIENKVH